MGICHIALARNVVKMVLEREIEATIIGIVVVIVLYNNIVQFVSDVAISFSEIKIGLLLILALSFVMKSRAVKKIAGY